MTEVTLTRAECDRDFLPLVCAKCGAPAADRVPRQTRYFAHGGRGWEPGGIIVGLFAFPPLAVAITLARAEIVEIGVPMCDAHRDDWGWRDRAARWILLPVWTVLLLAVFTTAAIVERTRGDGAVLLLLAPAVSLAALLIENVVLYVGTVKLGTNDIREGLRVRRVHPAFVAAVFADRERNPIADAVRPSRPDDYDDEQA